MKKISTLFKKDPSDLGRVMNEVDPKNNWVFESNVIPTQKHDGTACAVIDGELYKRYDCKIDKNTGFYKRQIPNGAIPCQNADKISGHHPHWIKCDIKDNSNKYHFEAFNKSRLSDGTYELCGEKVQGNPERITGHELIPHGINNLPISDFSFEAIKEYLTNNDIEGIVFHHKYNGFLMCKIRKSDFGIKR